MDTAQNSAQVTPSSSTRSNENISTPSPTTDTAGAATTAPSDQPSITPTLSAAATASSNTKPSNKKKKHSELVEYLQQSAEEQRQHDQQLLENFQKLQQDNMRMMFGFFSQMMSNTQPQFFNQSVPHSQPSTSTMQPHCFNVNSVSHPCPPPSRPSFTDLLNSNQVDFHLD
jgi:hypothetical protein